MIGIVSYIFIICLVALPSISSLYIANVVFYPLMFLKRRISVDRNGIILYLLFIGGFFISVMHMMIWLSGDIIISNRFIIHALFTIQYFVLIIKLEFDYKKFEDFFILISVFISFAMLFLFVLKGIYASPALFFIHNRMWGENYFNGWPNTTGLPLVFALFLLFKKGNELFDNWIIKGVLFTAIILTTSRTTLFGAVLVVAFYFIYPRLGVTVSFFRRRIWILILLGCVLTVALIKGIISTDIVERLFYLEDRLDIMRIVTSLMKYSPVFGFGGVTVDDAGALFGLSFELSHTHNCILELLVRYGIYGTFVFFIILIVLYKRIKSTDNKMMFIVMWIMALFQIYVRNFCFLFLISYLCYSEESNDIRTS